MRLLIIACFAALLGACSTPSFVGDAPRVPVTAKTPDHFELPARFAFARVVYGSTQTAGTKELALWADLAERAESLGSFAPLVPAEANRWHANTSKLAEAARKQRYNYLLLVTMDPSTAAADIALVHVGSGGVMATSQIASSAGGQRGFWGGRIRNPRRLERATYRIAQAAVPAVEEMLRGAAKRQR